MSIYSENVVLHSYRGAASAIVNLLNLELNEHPSEGKIIFDTNATHFWLCDMAYLQNTTPKNVVPDGFLDHPKTFMIIEIDHEAMHLAPVTKNCFDVVTQLIPKERIILITGNHQQSEYFLNRYPMLRDNVTFFNYWEVWCRRTTFTVNTIAKHKINNKRFLYINRRNYAQRFYAFSLLWKSEEFKKNCYASYNIGQYWNPPVNSNQVNSILTDCVNYCKSSDPDIETWFRQQELPQLPKRYSEQDPYQYQMLDDRLLQAYADTEINVIVESNAYNLTQGFFPTEKLFRTICMNQPFMVYAQPNYYRNLTALGYRTYETVFNEVHDAIADDHARGKSFADAVIKLANLDATKFSELMKLVERTRKHNYKNFLKRTDLDFIRNSLPDAAKPLGPYFRYQPY